MENQEIERTKKYKELTQEEKAEIVRKYTPLLSQHIRHYSVGLLYKHNEDLTQDGWMYVFRHWNKFDPLKSSRGTWVFHTFQQGCRNAVRKEYHYKTNVSIGLTEDSNMEQKDTTGSLLSEIKQLPKEYQKIVEDKVIHNLTAHEITKKYKLWGKNPTYKQIIREVAQLLGAIIEGE